MLDGLVVAGVALLAGAEPFRAGALGLSMTALQASIGALNDLHDARADAGHKRGKPIPAGLVSPPSARIVTLVTALTGLALAVAVGGGPSLILAGVVLGIGYGYDLIAKGTPWSWLPFAIGIPVLPLYGWLGGSGSVPAFFSALLPIAALAGAALAIANARADHERDAAAAVPSVSTTLGLHRAWVVHAVAWLGVAGLALGYLFRVGAADGWVGLVGIAAAALGVVVLAGRAGGPAHRERVWQAESVLGAAALVIWLAAVLTG